MTFCTLQHAPAGIKLLIALETIWPR